MPLVLSRAVNESLVFQVAGIEFTVQVSSISGNRTRLAIEAPREVVVMRREAMGQMVQAERTPRVSAEQVEDYSHLYLDFGGSE